MGLDEFGSTIKSARGVRGFQLNPEGNFTEWKVQGKIGGYTAYASLSLSIGVCVDTITIASLTPCAVS